MSRPIDGDRLIRGLKMNRIRILSELENDGAAVFDEVVEWIQNEPTLAPQNERLTFSELEKMDGQPVYIPKLHAWGLVNVGENTIRNYSGWTLDLYEASLMGAYRRPPERQEDAH